MTDAETCALPPEGWWCSRGASHEGPCAVRKRLGTPVAAPIPDAAPNERLVADREAVSAELESALFISGGEFTGAELAAVLFDSGILTDARAVRDAALTEAAAQLRGMMIRNPKPDINNPAHVYAAQAHEFADKILALREGTPPQS